MILLPWFKWTVSPPAYLKMDPFEHFGFGYLRAPEGSILQLELEVEKNPQRVGATIHDLDQTQPSRLKPPFSFIRKNSKANGRALSLIDLDAPERGSAQYDEFVFRPSRRPPRRIPIAKIFSFQPMPACWSRFSLRMITVSPTSGSTLPMPGKRRGDLVCRANRKREKLSFIWT